MNRFASSLAASLRGAALVVALGALGACSFEKSDGADTTIMNECREDLDCGEGICEAGLCIAREAEPALIGFEVVPLAPPTGTPSSWTFAAEPVEGASTRDLVAPKSLSVVGNVRWGGLRVPANLTFTRRPPFDGAPPSRLRVSTTAEPVEREASPDSQPADYAVRLVAGEVYDVLVEPTGEMAVALTDGDHAAALPWLRVLPPIRFEIETPSPEQGDIWRADISDAFYLTDLTTPCDESRFVGCELAGEIYSIDPDDGSLRAEDGLQVRATEIETGRTVSSTALTAEGEFSVRISPFAGPYVLRVAGGPDQPYFPTITVPPTRFFPGATPRIRVPRYRTVTYTGQVEGETERAESGGRLEGVTLSFVSYDVTDEELGLMGTFRATKVTDERGQFSVELLPGTYDIVLTPPAEGSFAVASRSVDLSGSTDEVAGQLFTLQRRASVGGIVQAFGGRPLPGTTVQASARGVLADITEEVAFAANRTSESVTDATGHFDLRVDLGSYDVLVKPPPESGFPWLVRPGLRVGAVGVDAPSTTRTWEIGAPVPLEGTLRSASGTPLVDAEIRAYRIVEDNDDVRPIQVGRAVTDEMGAYRILLPPR